MIIQLYAFEPGGGLDEHRVMVDTDNPSAIWAETDGPALLDTATPAQLGYAANADVTFFCVGTTKWRVRAQLDYPFAYTMPPQANSVDCGYTPPTCDIAITGVTVVNETVTGLGDGTATVNATSSNPPIRYSLDGVTYSTSNVFTGLAPGLYTAYVIDAFDCTASLPFAIAAAPEIPPGEPGGPDAALPPYPSNAVPCHWFKLNDVLIDEPAKWQDVTMKGERDKDYHGWNYQFSDEQFDLHFDCAAGSSIIDDVFSTAGPDGEVILEYGYTYNGEEVTLFTGRLDLNTLKRFPAYYACAVKRFDGNDLLETRQDVKISMAATQSLGGVAITPPEAIETTLHAKEIQRIYRINRTQSVFVDPQVVGGIGYTMPDTTTPEFSEVETNFAYPLDSTSNEPWTDNKYLIDVRFAGSYTIRVALGIRFGYLRYPPFTATSATAQAVLRINDEEINIGASVTSGITAAGTFFTLNVDQTVVRDLVPGDKLYIYVKHTSAPLGFFRIAAQELSNNITITSLESTAPTPCRGWWLFDAVDHAIRAVTDNNSALQSTLLRRSVTPSVPQGQAALHMLTNGFQIRKYQPTARPLVVSLKDMLESLRALFCIGVQYDDNRVVIERVDYFYQPNELLYIEEVEKLRKEVAKELLYNELEIGYETYQTDGFNSLDEFNTRRELLTPVQTNKAKLSQRCKFIASGYSIETSRRKQFETSASDSFQNDDATFIVSMRRDGDTYVPEKDEAFDSVTGIISPDTAYNLRLSPMRMLYNWVIWLRNVFHWKSGAELLRVTSSPQSKDLVTQLLVSDDRPLGDTDRALIADSASVAIEDLPTVRRLFIPQWITFECKLPPDVVQGINEALKGKSTASRNYGYIKYFDPDDGYVDGWPYRLEYNFYTWEATFTLLRKS